MSIIMWAGVTITVLLLAVLLVPISFHGQGCLSDKKTFQGEIAWAGGLASISMFMAEGGNVFSMRLGLWKKRLDKKSAAGQKEKVRETKNINRPGFLELIPFFKKQFLREILTFLGRAFRSLNLRLCVEGEYGTGDPALTGYLSALIGLMDSSRYKLRLNPNFQELVLNMRGEMRARLIPAVLIVHALGLFFAPAVRKIWWMKLKTKIKRRV